MPASPVSTSTFHIFVNVSGRRFSWAVSRRRRTCQAGSTLRPRRPSASRTTRWRQTLTPPEEDLRPATLEIDLPQDLPGDQGDQHRDDELHAEPAPGPERGAVPRVHDAPSSCINGDVHDDHAVS